MNKFIALFKKAGGKDILFQYIRAHVLLFAIFQIICQGFSKKSLEIVRLSINNKVLCRLRKKYKCFIADYLQTYVPLKSSQTHKVWVCWLQGIDHAPDLVKVCYQSLVDNLIDRDIILLTEENYRDYVNFPEFIQSKIDRGIISRTHFSDLLRLELLIRYGGTWIDATVYCSGRNIPDYMMNSDLFLFQNLKPGLDGHSTCISSWLLTACSNHPILLLTRALLYEYWSKNNALVDYFLLHDFFQLAIEAYQELWDKVIPFSNSIPHILLLRLFQVYDKKVWESIKNMTPFHKLSYKFSNSLIEKQGTYFEKLLFEFSKLHGDIL